MHLQKIHCFIISRGIGLMTIAIVMAVPALATVRMDFEAVVTNVPDGNTVVISERIVPGIVRRGLGYPPTIRLNGIESPGLDCLGGEEAREMLEKLTLNKKFYISELFDTGISRGACLLVTNFVHQDTIYDCINFMMVSNGMSRYTGFSAAYFDTRDAEKIQQQAQLERRGIWGLPSAPPPVPSINAPVTVSTYLPSVPAAVPAETNAPPAAGSTAIPSLRSRLAVPLVVGASILLALFLLTKFRKK